jgi:hypothetical protein
MEDEVEVIFLQSSKFHKVVSRKKKAIGVGKGGVRRDAMCMVVNAVETT